MDTNEAADGDDQGQSKKVTKACDVCRKRKIKCDGTSPCFNCINHGISCVFSDKGRPRKTPLRSAKRIDELEARLTSIEAFMKNQKLLPKNDHAETRRSNGKGKAGQKSPSTDGYKGTTEAADTLEFESNELTPTSMCDKSSCAGASPATVGCFGSPLAHTASLPSTVAGFNGDLAVFSDQDSEFSSLWDGTFSNSFSQRTHTRLPPLYEALPLLHEYFNGFNCVFPIFHQPSFLRQVVESYTRDCQEDSGWWAALNVALALAHRLRAMKVFASQEEDQLSWRYLQNALAVVAELTLRNTDLLGVQALLGMAIILQGTPNPHPASVLVTTAIRLSHNLGLHNKDHNLGLTSLEMEQRNRVFWIAYVLDKDFCLRLNQPPIQSDDDIGINLPSKNPKDGVGSIVTLDGTSSINFFRLRVHLAVIQGRIYKDLYSMQALRHSERERTDAIQDLDRMLKNWKSGIPFDFQPENIGRPLSRCSILHLVILHLSYLNCLAMVHRVSIQNNHWTADVLNSSKQGLSRGQSTSSHKQCLEAARASVRLLQLLPQGDYAFMWLLLYFYISGVVILLANVLDNPSDSQARSDMEIVKPLLRVLDMLTEKGKSKDLSRMHSFVIELEREGMIALEKATLEGQSGLKRKRDAEHNAFGGIDPALDFGNKTPRGYGGSGRGTLALAEKLEIGTSLGAGTFETLDWTDHQSEIGVLSALKVSDSFNLRDPDKFFLNKEGNSDIFTEYPSVVGLNMGLDDTGDSDPMLMPLEWVWDGDEDEGLALARTQG